MGILNLTFSAISLNTSLKKTSLLRNPIQQGNHKEQDDSYIEELINKNIIDKHSREYLAALEIRTLFHSLSPENKKKFIKIVKAFEFDKENLKYFIGEIWSGGGMRVISGSGPGSVINAISLLTGMKFKHYRGVSAGSFQALSRHLGCLNSLNINTTIEAPFETFPQQRVNLLNWATEWPQHSYKLSTGRDSKGPITGEHLAEFDSDFDVLVGKSSNSHFPFNHFSTDIFWLYQEAENRYGLIPSDIPVAKAVEAATNLTGLFYNPFDKTFGNCVIEDSSGNNHYHFDPGLNSLHRTPLELQIEEIEKYKRTGEKPGIFFIFDYQNVNNQDINKLKKEGGKVVNETKSNIGRVVDTVIWAHDLYESLPFMNRAPENRTMQIGTNRAFIKANCITIDPDTGKIIVLETGKLSTPSKDRETIIGASIPTSDFNNIDNSIIDQLYNNFVDEEFIRTNGQSGHSAYKLILNDIDNSIKKNR